MPGVRIRVRSHSVWDWVIACAIAAAMFAATAAVKALQCHLEQVRYEQLTGQHVSLWDAWLLDLEVSAGLRPERPDQQQGGSGDATDH